MKLTVVTFLLAVGGALAGGGRPPTSPPAPTAPPTPSYVCTATSTCEQASKADCLSAANTCMLTNSKLGCEVKGNGCISKVPEDPPLCSTAKNSNECNGAFRQANELAGRPGCWYDKDTKTCTNRVLPTCQIQVVDNFLYSSKVGQFDFVEIQSCTSDDPTEVWSCDMYPNFPEGDIKAGDTFFGICEKQCTAGVNGNGNNNVNSPATGNDKSTERVTICHRTCSAKNPWVRITIDRNAWNESQCEGHNNHEVLYVKDSQPLEYAECATKILKIAADENIDEVAARQKYWGNNDHDYLLKWHGTRDAVKTINGFDAKEEKAYWKEWEPACPYVNNDKCCNWFEGSCCGEGSGLATTAPVPLQSNVLLEKYSCSKNVPSCSQADVTAALATGDCDEELYTGFSGDDAKYCYKIYNTGAVKLCSFEMTDEAIKDPNQPGVRPIVPGGLETPSAGAGCLAPNTESMWTGPLGRLIPAHNTTEETYAVVAALPEGATDYIGYADLSALKGLDASVEITKHACEVGADFNCANVLGNNKCTSDILYRVGGTTASYCYVVKNTGTTTLCEISMVDNQFPSDVVTVDGCLQSQVTKYLNVKPIPTITAYQNEPATVTAYPFSADGATKLSTSPVSDFDSAGVKPFSPSIEILKVACEDSSGLGTAFDCKAAIESDACAKNTLFKPMGTNAVYCTEVKNTGTTTLCDVQVVDLENSYSWSMPNGGCFEPNDKVYPAPNPKKVDEKTSSYANVTATPKDNGQAIGSPVKDSDPAGVSPSSPGIDLEKLVCPNSGDGTFSCSTAQGCEPDLLFAQNGDTVTYCYLISNPSTDTTICSITMTDTDGVVRTVDGCLGPGEETYGPPRDLIVNGPDGGVATASGTPVDENQTPTGAPPVTATDPAAVEPAGDEPKLDITKLACLDPNGDGESYDCSNGVGCEPYILYAPQSTLAVYCFEVENTGNSVLCDVTVVDDDGHTSTATGSGLTSTGQVMPAGCLNPGDKVFTDKANPVPNIQGPEYGPATVSATPYNDAADKPTGDTVKPVEDSAGVEPSGSTAAIQIEKFACSATSSVGSVFDCETGISSGACVDHTLFAPAGETALFCYKVTNTGSSTLCKGTVKDNSDPQVAPYMNNALTGPSMPEGCLKSGDVVFPPPTATFPVAPGKDGDLLGGFASVDGIPYSDDGSKPNPKIGKVEDKDDAYVDPSSPYIVVEKTVCSVAHDTSPESFDCASQVNTIHCFPETLYTTVGQTAVYCYSVKNPSDTKLCEVTLTDVDGTAMPVPDGVMPDGCLTPGSATPVFSIPRLFTVSANGDENFNGDVTAVGTPYNDLGTLPTGGNPVTDTDSADVVISNPGISLKKYACLGTTSAEAPFNCEAAIGTDACEDYMLFAPANTAAVYCFEVTNIGDIILCNVTLVDSDGFLPDMADGCLESNESFYPEANPVPLIVEKEAPETGFAVVVGYPFVSDGSRPTGGEPVDDSDNAGVDPSMPEILLKKWACPATMSDGSPVDGSVDCEALVNNGECEDLVLFVATGADATYCYVVTNPSDTTLCNIMVVDTDSVERSLSQCLPVGGSAFLDPRVLPNSAIPDEGLATVTGYPFNDEGTAATGGAAVTATDDAGVKSAGTNPMIDITKYACSDPNKAGVSYDCAAGISSGACQDDTLFLHYGEDAVYCYNVTNNGDSTLCEVEMLDNDGSIAVVTAGADMPDGCMSSGSSGFATPRVVQPYTEENAGAQNENPAAVKGYPYSDDGTQSTGGEPVHAHDPAVILPGGNNPAIAIKMYACTDVRSPNSDFSCADIIGTDTCEDFILKGDLGLSALYCFAVENTGNTTLCNVIVKNDFLGIDWSMGHECLDEGQKVYPPELPTTIDEFENSTTTVTGIPSDAKNNQPTGQALVEDQDDAGLEPLTNPPTKVPTAGPTEAPVPPLIPVTDAPVVDPTEAPVPPLVPVTDAPVVDPTSAPVVDPTSAPVIDPTSAPVVDPTPPPPTPPTTPPPPTPPTDCDFPMTQRSTDICPGADVVKIISIDGEKAQDTVFGTGISVIYDIAFEENGRQVSWKVKNPFAGQTDVYIVYHEAFGDSLYAFRENCVLDQWNSDCEPVGDTASITSECSASTGVSWASVYFVTSDDAGADANATIDECCDSGPVPAGSHVVRYTFLINCSCPEVAGS